MPGYSPPGWIKMILKGHRSRCNLTTYIGLGYIKYIYIYIPCYDYVKGHRKVTPPPKSAIL